MRPFRDRLAIGVIATAGAIAIFLILETFAAHLASGNSDGATVILEGQSIAHGNVLLHGWILSQDSFWSVDALAYAAAVAVAGVSPGLLHVVPAAIATLVVLVSIRLATVGNAIAGRAIAVTFVLGSLAIPAAVWAPFYLAGPYHVGTALLCLIAFWLCLVRPEPLRLIAATIVLSAGILGDLQTIALGVLPLGIAGLIAMWRTWTIRPGIDRIGVAGSSAVLALVVRKCAELIGTFTLAPARTPAPISAFAGNLGRGLRYFANLIGVGTGPFGPNPVPTPFDAARVMELAVIAVALAVALGSLLLGLVSERHTAGPAAWEIDDVLVVGTVGTLGMYAYLATSATPADGRYLSAAVIYSSILGARVCGRAWRRLARTLRWPLGAFAGLWLACLAGSGIYIARATPPPQPAKRLVAFLDRHHLESGLGGYWTASITTVQSNEAIRLRPVITGASGRVVRYARQSDASWYRGEKPTFLAFTKAVAVDSITRASAIATYGRPLRTYAVGSYWVLVYRSLPEPVGRGYST